jgi:hypothetical protein
MTRGVLRRTLRFARAALQGARTGIRKMVTLVWSKEAAIKAVVIESYQKLFLSQKCTENAPAEGMAMALNFIK